MTRAEEGAEPTRDYIACPITMKRDRDDAVAVVASVDGQREGAPSSAGFSEADVEKGAEALDRWVLLVPDARLGAARAVLSAVLGEQEK